MVNYQKLYQNNQFQALIEQAREQKEISSDRLYWEGMSYLMLKEDERAYDTFNLYLAIAKEKDPHYWEVGDQMISLAFRQRHFAQVLFLFEKKSTKTTEDAQYGYQAALALGKNEEAEDIFSKYLASTLDSFSYAKMLATGTANAQVLLSSMTGLSNEEKLEIFSLVNVQNLSIAEASILLPEAQSLIGTVKNTKNLYRILADLAFAADKRVLSNKYQVLENREE